MWQVVSAWLSHDCHVIDMSSFLLLIDSVHLTSKCEVFRVNALTLVSVIQKMQWHRQCAVMCAVILFYWKHRILQPTHCTVTQQTQTHVTYMCICVVHMVHTPELPCIPTCLWKSSRIPLTVSRCGLCRLARASSRAGNYTRWEEESQTAQPSLHWQMAVITGYYTIRLVWLFTLCLQGGGWRLIWHRVGS